jgi:acid phosphatase type 7
MRRWRVFGWVVVALATITTSHKSFSHDGPDPRASWLFESAFLDPSGGLRSQAGPNLAAGKAPRAEKVGKLECLRLEGEDTIFHAKGDWEEILSQLPVDALTVSAWVSLDETLPDGGILSVFQDNGNAEKGWVLGYNQQHFFLGLASEGADDGDGKMTYLAGKTSIEPGKWYHVCGVYDGEAMQLWVNGQLDGESREQHGKILYPKEARMALGAYLDSNESFPLVGRLAQVVVYDLAAKPAWIVHDFEHQKDWVALPPQFDPSKDFEFVVKPYLQFATPDSIRVMCEVTRPSKVRVRFGETIKFTETASATSDDSLLHTALLADLKPEMAYYYQVEVEEEGRDGVLKGDVSSFQTVSAPETPFAFAVIADTQGNPQSEWSIGAACLGPSPQFPDHSRGFGERWTGEARVGERVLREHESAFLPSSLLSSPRQSRAECRPLLSVHGFASP